MSKVTIRSRRAPAVLCRENGWAVGTCLQGDEGYGPSIIRITAIGEVRILAREIRRDGIRCFGWESTWTLDCRDWHEVPDPDGKWQIEEEA